MAGSGRWWLEPIPDRVWLQLELQRGIDVEGIRQEILFLVVNSGVDRINPTDLPTHAFTIRAFLRGLERDGLLTVREMANHVFAIGSVSPLARRALRNGA